MRAVLVDWPMWMLEDMLAERRQKGQDKLDEMWEGELHMVPPPSFEHNVLRNRLYDWLVRRCAALSLGIVEVEMGVYRAPQNWRVPDISSVARGREAEVIREEGFVGAPDVVIEVRSPGDESTATPGESRSSASPAPTTSAPPQTPTAGSRSRRSVAASAPAAPPTGRASRWPPTTPRSPPL